IRAAVQLKVQLAHPYRKRGGFGGAAEPLEEGVHSREGRLGKGREARQLTDVLNHVGRRPSAPVSVTDREQALRMDGSAPEVAPHADQGVGRWVTVVTTQRLARTEGVVVEAVGKHAAAVEAFPPVEVVRKAVGFRPGELGREERVDSGTKKQLRQTGREA